MTITTTLLAILIWLTLWFIIGQRLQQKIQHNTPLQRRPWLNIGWLLALGLHGFSLLNLILMPPQLSLSFTATASLVMWMTGLLLYFTQIQRPLEALGVFVIPLIILGLVLQLIPTESGNIIILTNALGIHIITSLLAYSMFVLASLQALLLAVQNRHLHNHQPGGLIKTLPPLMDMEAMLFKLLWLGVLLLSAGLITGMLYVDDFFGQHVAHKALLSFVAWIIFATLLAGHWFYGWRGRMAIRWTLTGTTILLVGFLGSKFILEYLVDKA